MATIANMNATSSTVAASPSAAGIYHIPQITPESADSVSDLLQKNHVKHHVFFNDMGFHNHIVHHLLTIFALGASPDQLQSGFDFNKGYQRPQKPLRSDIVKQMIESRNKIPEFFGKEQYYHDYQEFFAGELEKKGTKATLNEWLFKGDGVAEAMLTRTFAGFYHPIIHFGFALEFHQPAILAEALAQTAVHDNWMSPFLLGCERAAAARGPQLSKTLISLLHEAKSNETIRSFPHPEDSNEVRDGVMSRAATPMINLVSQWTVSPTQEDVKFRTAEMIQAAVYFTIGALNPKKIPKFDFFCMHSVNTSIFYSAFIEDKVNREIFFDDEPARKNYVRLLEMKGRADIVMYVSRGSAELDMQRIKEYEGKNSGQGWSQLFERACALEDDGHSSKLLRAVANGERVCKEYEIEHGWPVQGDMWLKIGHMVMDSVEAGGPKWVRGAGFEEAWTDVPDRMDAKL